MIRNKDVENSATTGHGGRHLWARLNEFRARLASLAPKRPWFVSPVLPSEKNASTLRNASDEYPSEPKDRIEPKRKPPVYILFAAAVAQDLYTEAAAAVCTDRFMDSGICAVIFHHTV